jgi:outer membrane immunogenic protein
MRRLYQAAAAIPLVLAVSTMGNAADLPVAVAPPPVYPSVLFSWTGFYLGGNVGGGWTADSVTDTRFGQSFILPTRDPVFLGGAQAGFNYQFSNLVGGIEADFDWLNHNNSSAGPVVIPNVGVFSVSSANRWVSTIAGRLGVASDRWLVYLKAGGGFVSYDSFTVTNVNTGASIAAANNNTDSGWLLGAGLEWAFLPNWTTKLEYDYLSLNRPTFTIPATAPFLANDTFNLGGNNRSFQMVKAGVNYKFSWWTEPTVINK